MNSALTSPVDRPLVSIRAFAETDLPETDHIFRMAFGTYLGLPEPLAFAAGRDFIRWRWRMEPAGAFVAEVAGQLAGSAVANRWGSVGFFGPLTVHPRFWDKGVGARLVATAMERFESWGCPFVGLFTFAQSTKHVGLYQRFGFRPRFLTAVMTRVAGGLEADAGWCRFSALTGDQQRDVLVSCRALTEEVFPGLDVSAEIAAVAGHRLGETILLYGDHGLDALAVTHFGDGTEGGRETLYVKFAVVRPGPDAATHLARLLAACDVRAVRERLAIVETGVNTAREEAHAGLLAAGFKTQILGVAMHRDGRPGYSRPGLIVLDDWR